jgi:hypothetical protein
MFGQPNLQATQTVEQHRHTTEIRVFTQCNALERLFLWWCFDEADLVA